MTLSLVTIKTALRGFGTFLALVWFSQLAGCGGGTASTAPPPPPGTLANSIQLLVARPTINSDGNSQVGLTAVVLDENSRAMSGKSVRLTISDPNSTAFLSNLSNPGALTDTNGLLSGQINVGTNKGNRTISVTANADSVSATTTVNAVGTSLLIQGANTLVAGASTQLTISLKDSGANAIQNADVTISSARGNTLSATTGTTNVNGQVLLTVTGTVSGNDTITASALGATATAAISVSGSNFTFVAPSPAPNTDVDVNTNHTVRVQWVESGIPQAGRAISFSATRGTVAASSTTTDGSGLATTTITSASTGAVSVTASGPGGTPSASLEFVFVTRTADRINVQADRTTLPVNLGATDTSRSTIRAIVRDSANNLVKNARVLFQIVADTTGGRLSTGSDITDIAGEATTDYIAGTISSNTNGVEIRATVVDVNGVAVPSPAPATLSGLVRLTVAGQSLFVRLGADNLVTKNAATASHSKVVTAIVSDAGGNPVQAVRVQFELNPAQPPITAYQKGRYVVVGGGAGGSSSWTKELPAEGLCFNEDLNLNGILEPLMSEDLNYSGTLDVGEDLNGNGLLDLRSLELTDLNGNGKTDTNEDFNSDAKLTPGDVANATNDVVTDSRGLAATVVTYPQDFSTWATVTVQAKIRVSGTEAVDSMTFTLPGIGADYTNAAAAPPGVVSPFGTQIFAGDTIATCASRF